MGINQKTDDEFRCRVDWRMLTIIFLLAKLPKLLAGYERCTLSLARPRPREASHPRSSSEIEILRMFNDLNGEKRSRKTKTKAEFAVGPACTGRRDNRGIKGLLHRHNVRALIAAEQKT